MVEGKIVPVRIVGSKDIVGCDFDKRSKVSCNFDGAVYTKGKTKARETIL